MGCILSLFGFVFKILKLVVKTVAKVVIFVVTLLIKLGLLFPLLYAAAGLGLMAAGSDIMTAGTTGFVIYHIGFAALTLICVFASIKRAINRHNQKYDENGKKIKE